MEEEAPPPARSRADRIRPPVVVGFFFGIFEFHLGASHPLSVGLVFK